MLATLLSKRFQETYGMVDDYTLLSESFQNTNRVAKADLRKIQLIRSSFESYTVSKMKLEKIRSTRQAGKYCVNLLSDKAQERLLLICLNTKNEVTHVKEIFIGTNNASVVHPREVFREAVKYNATKIIVCHNHPSGDYTPSPEDLRMTERLVKCGDLMGVDLLDHIIVGGDEYLSLREAYLELFK